METSKGHSVPAVNATGAVMVNHAEDLVTVTVSDLDQRLSRAWGGDRHRTATLIQELTTAMNTATAGTVMCPMYITGTISQSAAILISARNRCVELTLPIAGGEATWFGEVGKVESLIQTLRNAVEAIKAHENYTKEQ